MTPPTQKITAGGIRLGRGDGVLDDHSLAVDHDLLDDEAENATTVIEAGAFGCVAKSSEEALQCLRKLKVGLLVDQLRLQSAQLGAQTTLLGTQRRCARAQLGEG